MQRKTRPSRHLLPGRIGDGSVEAQPHGRAELVTRQRDAQVNDPLLAQHRVCLRQEAGHRR